MIRIHQVQKRICVLEIKVSSHSDLLQTRSVNNHFIQLAHAANELQSARAAIHVHVVNVSVNIHRNNILTVVRGLERGMD